MSHTEGRLEVVTDCQGECCWHIQRVGNTDKFNRITSVEMSEEIARRLVACWNAMEGIEDPEMWVMQMMYMDGHFGTLLEERDDLVKERDELVVELRDFFEKGYSRSRSERIRKLLKKYPEAS